MTRINRSSYTIENGQIFVDRGGVRQPVPGYFDKATQVWRVWVRQADGTYEVEDITSAQQGTNFVGAFDFGTFTQPVDYTLDMGTF